jgi:hypothetical protein
MPQTGGKGLAGKSRSSPLPHQKSYEFTLYAGGSPTGRGQITRTSDQWWRAIESGIG